MKLNIYADEAFINIREVREVPRMKIPYRTAETLAKLIGDLDLSDESKILREVLQNVGLLTSIVRATFGLPEEDLPYIDIMELGDLAREVIAYVVQEMERLGVGEENDPNPQTPATT